MTAIGPPPQESPEEFVTRGIERRRKDKPPPPISRPDHYPQPGYAEEPGHAGGSESQGLSGPYYAASSWHPPSQGPETHSQQHQHQQYTGYQSHLHGQQGSPPHQQYGIYPPQPAAGGYFQDPSWHSPAYAPQGNIGQYPYPSSPYPQRYPQGTQHISAPPQAQSSYSGASYPPQLHYQNTSIPQHYSPPGQKPCQTYSQAYSPPFGAHSNPPPFFGHPSTDTKSYSGTPTGARRCFHEKVPGTW